MTKRILVPLDGKSDHEAVLSLVADIARSAGSMVRLISVKPVPEPIVDAYGRIAAYADQEMTRLEAGGLDYLAGAAAQLEGVPVERVVRFGDAVSEIAVEADTWAADLIALTEPEMSRLRRAVGRPLAAQVRSKVDIPLLLYRPTGS